MAWVYSDYSANPETRELALLISERSQQLALAVIREMQERGAWEGDDGEPVSDSEWDDIDEAVANLISEIIEVKMPDFTPVGTVLAFFGLEANIPEKWLLCDGSSHINADYPELVDILPSFYVSGSNFFTPDLRERFVFGTPNDAGIGAVGGENTHVLTISEMPAHTHVQQGRNSPAGGVLQSAVAVNIAAGGAVATTTATGSQGGGNAHNNVPAHVTMHYIIKALP